LKESRVKESAKLHSFQNRHPL